MITDEQGEIKDVIQRVLEKTNNTNNRAAKMDVDDLLTLVACFIFRMLF